MVNSTMRAVRIHDYGEPDALVMETVPTPQPGEGQVLIKVHAAGVNPMDWKLRSGMFKAFMPVQMPWIPGGEAAGVVEAVGPGVTQFKPGQPVFGFVNAAYAEYALAAAGDLVLKPESMSFAEAASVPVGALTAWGALIDTVQVQAGQRVLVHGGAGGVGAYGVQLAHWKGAHVLATASAVNGEFVRSLGADEVIDYQKVPFETVVKPVDIVFDTVGGDLHARSLKVLPAGGKFVTVAGRLPPDFGKDQGIQAVGAGRASAANLPAIVDLIKTGKMKPVVGKVFKFSEAPQAHRYSQLGHGRGRVILQMID